MSMQEKKLKSINVFLGCNKNRLTEKKRKIIILSYIFDKIINFVKWCNCWDTKKIRNIWVDFNLNYNKCDTGVCLIEQNVFNV